MCFRNEGNELHTNDYSFFFSPWAEILSAVLSFQASIIAILSPVTVKPRTVLRSRYSFLSPDVVDFSTQTTNDSDTAKNEKKKKKKKMRKKGRMKKKKKKEKRKKEKDPIIEFAGRCCFFLLLLQLVFSRCPGRIFNDFRAVRRSVCSSKLPTYFCIALKPRNVSSGRIEFAELLRR